MEPIEVQTANGGVIITHKCRVYVVELDLWIWAHLLEFTVAVLSLGALLSEKMFFPMHGRMEKSHHLQRGTLKWCADPGTPSLSRWRGTSTLHYLTKTQ